MNIIALIGASGFIGKHLVAELLKNENYRIKLLSRVNTSEQEGVTWPAKVEIIQGDLMNDQSLCGFLEPNCIVINLAYLWDQDQMVNLAATKNLLDACKLAKVRRLIHCSTMDVVGRTPDEWITEKTECRPISAYGITKLKLEQLIASSAKGNFDAAFLRPTAVFGPGGMNLEKLANDLTTKNRLKNYLKSCLFDRRRMNLVNVANLVAAIIFLINLTEIFNGEIFIVSDDDSPTNNFAAVERVLMSALHCPDYFLPRIPVPQSVLSLLLSLLGRNNINPRCNYSQAKLQNLGFKPPVNFDAGLMEYASWQRAKLVDEQRGDVN
jgi:nucleoside-diphosphate-sugar epimerase